MKKILISIASLALALPGVALAAPGDMQRHQSGAGTLDADGFTSVRTVTGGMTFEMPCKFNELSFADAPNSDGKSPYAKAATIVVCVEPEKLEGWALVLRAGYDTGAAGADYFFDKQLADDTKIGKVDRIKHKGDRAFISLVKDATMCKWKLAVRRGADLVTINYFARADDCSTTKAKALRIFNSLAFVG